MGHLIHRVWFGPEPPYVAESGQGMAAVNDDAEVITWTAETLPAGLTAVLEATRGQVVARDFYRHWSNITRYWLLYEHGGIYVDCDVWAHRPFGPLFASPVPFCASWCDGRPEGAVLGGPPGHAFYRRLFEHAVANKRGGGFSADASGARLLAQMVHRYRVDVRPFTDFFGDWRTSRERQDDRSGFTTHAARRARQGLTGAI